ncbi:MAG: hypothetical protein D3906_17965, partial [Candidatus Electrothrix sp. AUS1_2]|nr:hypothetical protein [Candidatus Electrothrix sp. AUS1_2]
MRFQPVPLIYVNPSCTDLAAQAQELAARLGLPMEPPECSSSQDIRLPEQCRLQLRVSADGLA